MITTSIRQTNITSKEMLDGGYGAAKAFLGKVSERTIQESIIGLGLVLVNVFDALNTARVQHFGEEPNTWEDFLDYLKDTPVDSYRKTWETMLTIEHVTKLLAEETNEKFGVDPVRHHDEPQIEDGHYINMGRIA